MAETHEGYLLIADITGYTRYLNQSELEHAQQTLTVLLKLLVEHTRPPLVISRLEGDAVISYGLRDQFYQGQTFVEVIEDTYVAFRKAVERIALNNTCRCNACANIGSLDLKFFIHYGAFALQRIGSYDELVGSDVVLVHRLLKNRVEEQTGLRAYTLWTDAALRRLGLEDFQHGLIAHREGYEHLGDVAVWVQDMHPVWERKRSSRQINIPAGQAASQIEVELAVSPEVLWDYLGRLDFRRTLLGSERQEVTHTTAGRVGRGSVYQCYHGERIIPQTILEWQPFERMVLQTLIPIPIPNTTVLSEFRLEPVERGTRLVEIDSHADGPFLGRFLVRLAEGRLARQTREQLEHFKARVESDALQRAASLSRRAEPGDEAVFQAAAESLRDSGGQD